MENKEIINSVVKKYFEETPDNVISVSYGFKSKNGVRTNEIGLIFFVEKKLPLEQIPDGELIPNSIEYSGLTFITDVLEGICNPLQSVTSCPAPFENWRSVSPPNRSLTRPLKSGISITNWTKLSNSVGTFGFLAVDNETNTLVGVSNNHVLILDAWYASLRPVANGISNTFRNIVTQPNDGSFFGPNYKIGEVKNYVPMTASSPTVVYNKVDLATFTVASGQINSASTQMVGMTGWTQPMDWATTSEIDDLLSTDPNLYSAGRTSGAKGEGLTKLKVVSIIGTCNPLYRRQNSSVPAYFDDCIIYQASASTTAPGFICWFPVAPGDSGSALCADIGGVRKIIGLVFAGFGQFVGSDFWPYYGIACRIDNVASALNLSPYTGQTVNFCDILNQESVCLSTNATDKSIVISGKTFWQVGLC